MPDTTRRARKNYQCQQDIDWKRLHSILPHLRFCPIPDGLIHPGDLYVECPEEGEPFHPTRYHLACRTDAR